MLKNNKKIIFIVIAILLITATTFGTVIILSSLNNNAVKTPAVSAQESADNSKKDAIKALDNNDNTNAKTLFEEAQKKYEALGDKDNTIDTEAQLYLLEHSGTPTE